MILKLKDGDVKLSYLKMSHQIMLRELKNIS